jgi:hypothetical protein
MPEDPHRRDLTIFSLLNPRMPEEIVKYEIEEYLPTSLKIKVELASLDDLNFEMWDKTTKILFLYHHSIIQSEKNPYLTNHNNPYVKTNEIYQEDAYLLLQMWGRKKDAVINLLWEEFIGLKRDCPSKFPKMRFLNTSVEVLNLLPQDVLGNYANRLKIKKEAYYLQQRKGVERNGKMCIRLLEPDGRFVGPAGHRVWELYNDSKLNLTFFQFRRRFFPTTNNHLVWSQGKLTHH